MQIKSQKPMLLLLSIAKNTMQLAGSGICDTVSMPLSQSSTPADDSTALWNTQQTVMNDHRQELVCMW